MAAELPVIAPEHGAARGKSPRHEKSVGEQRGGTGRAATSRAARSGPPESQGTLTSSIARTARSARAGFVAARQNPPRCSGAAVPAATRPMAVPAGVSLRQPGRPSDGGRRDACPTTFCRSTTKPALWARHYFVVSSFCQRSSVMFSFWKNSRFWSACAGVLPLTGNSR